MAKIGKTLLKLDNVTMKFGGVTALNGVNLEVKEGEMPLESYTIIHKNAIRITDVNNVDFRLCVVSKIAIIFL